MRTKKVYLSASFASIIKKESQNEISSLEMNGCCTCRSKMQMHIQQKKHRTSVKQIRLDRISPSAVCDGMFIEITLWITYNEKIDWTNVHRMHIGIENTN